MALNIEVLFVPFPPTMVVIGNVKSILRFSSRFLYEGKRIDLIAGSYALA